MQIKTERLLLRVLSLDDTEAIFAYRSNAEANKYQGWIPKTKEDVIDFIQNKVSPFLDIVDTWFQFAIVQKSTNKVIGDIGIHFLDEHKKQVEIGCTISIDQQRKGYASEALTEIINYLFTTLNNHRIIASVDPENFNSIKLIEGLGFVKEAHFRKSLLINGRWVDDIIYALLKSDWDK